MEWEYALALAALTLMTAVVGVINRLGCLVQRYYVDGGWPGLAHYRDLSAQVVCWCGHHLSVHDADTGRCCHGLPLDHLATVIALPLPPLVCDLVQWPGCPCARACPHVSQQQHLTDLTGARLVSRETRRAPVVEPRDAADSMSHLLWGRLLQGLSG
ncbi:MULTISPECIES: hypothetical protein [unclassified Nocardiopsis]|uniref:hypothetical protein n=1 Tax=unclassified Nocardiopsis TaxID=2649073 RepID=UPI001915DF3D|nr:MULTISPECIES: hypothetical protein [unclassified Nocardiopsis]